MASKILIIEDDPATLELLEDTLQLDEYDTLKAQSAAEARKFFYSQPIDLAIVDRRLPDDDGLDLIKDLRTKPCLRYTAIVFLSGRSLLHDKLDGLSAGADDYLSKPFSPRELLSRVKAILKFTAPMLNLFTRLPSALAFTKELSFVNQMSRRDVEFFGMYLTHYELLKTSMSDKHDSFMGALGEIITRELATFEMEDFVAHMSEDLFLLVTGVNKSEAILKKVDKQLSSIRKKVLHRSPIDYLRKSNDEMFQLRGEPLSVEASEKLSLDLFQEKLNELKASVGD